MALKTEKCWLTPGGGIAVRLTNRTGAASVIGSVVDPSVDHDNAFRLAPVDSFDPIGVVYEAGVADGDECWVVLTGKAQVLFASAATRSHMARVVIAADGGANSGLAQSEEVPTPPAATDKHFREIGHVLETTAGAGLAWCVLHFN